jgi:hypothetical protein
MSSWVLTFWIATLPWIEMKVCASIKLHLAYHVDSTTLADGNYQLIPEPEGGCPEDPANFVREFSEGPNQSSDVINLTNPSPTSKGKPRTWPTILIILQSISIYVILYIKFLGIAWNPRCMDPRNQCIAPEVISIRCSANRTGRSRVIPCHSRDIGNLMFTFLLSL